jgi:uncharacterized protein
MTSNLHLFILAGFLFCSCSERPDTKYLEGPQGIIDNADILTEVQEDSIVEVIKKLRLEVGSEIAVLTIDSLGARKLEEFSLSMADSLKVGRASHNDGVLITISFYDRRARIEVGTGLENIIKDELAGEIIREQMAPEFRQEKYGLGIYLAVAKIAALIRANEKLVGTEPSRK